MSCPAFVPLAASLLAALLPPHGHETRPPGRFEVPEQGAAVPLDAWGGRPVVEARTEGGETLRLLVDTGASAVLLLAADAPAVRELRLGEARLVEPPTERIDFPLGGEQRLHGILGIRAFEGLVVCFDFGARRLELGRGPLPAELQGAVAFRRDGAMGGIPTIPLRAGGVSLEAHLDTGSPELLLVPSELVGRLPTRGEPRVVGRAMTPMGGAEIREIALEGALEIGALRREAGTLRIGDLPQIAGKGLGNVGARLFEGHRLTLDLASDRLLVAPSEPAKPKEPDGPAGAR
jgi:hypothetical protein